MDLSVETVDPSRTYELRHRVLRPGRPLTETIDNDAFASSVTFGLTEGDDPRILATATVYPEDPPPTYAPLVSLSKTHRPWRLRAVATDEQRRGEGFGGLYLAQSSITSLREKLRCCGATHASPPRRSMHARGFYPMAQSLKSSTSAGTS